jgi:adenylate kinase family enzyme
VPHRILVIGASGAGKSTLGRALAQHLDVPYVELDALYHGPNWQAATAQELLDRVLKATGDPRGWVVDGSYLSQLGNVIIDRAESIVWLDLPLSTKLRRLARRTARRWLRNEELWNGNRETLKDALWGYQSAISVAGAQPFPAAPRMAQAIGWASDGAPTYCTRGRPVAVRGPSQTLKRANR